MSEHASLPIPSGNRIERALALALLSLVSLYAIGSIVPVSTLDTIGVVAVHLAVVVGCLLTATVLFRTATGRLAGRSSAKRLRQFATGAATVVFGSFTVAFVLSEFSAPSVVVRSLLAITLGALLVLAGVVARRG
ncbi:hypothetical protein AUR64_08475 [Haloprofundus marisrubri]|uniref:Uncharacterized protein n=1 Tax=Haloprofundus marisrubri TaxID=1514971 RepID=A0A0W1R993_9EURY|nr:hypothetical protein [Haloprofundus marisrubri]KTG09669.1 hypothetical protein AUR64_08475 [Haloprofundus marisrubri]